VIAGVALFAAAMVLSALAPTYWLYAATLMFTGFSVVTMLTTANGYVQTTTDPALRGRVLAIMSRSSWAAPDRRAHRRLGRVGVARGPRSSEPSRPSSRSASA
jgi:hypothetical protein